MYLEKKILINPNRSSESGFTETELQNQPYVNRDQSSTRSNLSHEKVTELLVLLDSNGRYINKRKLWRADNAKYHTCSTLHDVCNVIEKVEQIESLKYVFVNVGVNDCDTKDHEQVFGEMKMVIDQIRRKIPNAKIIMSEITPRTDDRDIEVQLCNTLLHDYAQQHDDIIVTVHKNLRDATWSMFRDTQHIHEMKVPKFAANIIRALKEAYNITNKSALFSKEKHTGTGNRRNTGRHFPLDNRLKNLANYHSNDGNNVWKNNITNHELMYKKLKEVFDEFN